MDKTLFFSLFLFQVLAEPGYGEDIRRQGFVPHAPIVVEVGSAPNSPLKSTDQQRWPFPPVVQRNLETNVYFPDHISPRPGIFVLFFALFAGESLTLSLLEFSRKK